MCSLTKTLLANECSRCWLSAAAVGVPTIYLFWRYWQGGQFTKNTRIDGKVAIITGAFGGIGRENALDFALRGGRVYLAGRNVEAGQKARDEIVAKSNNANVFVLKLDLSSLQSVRDFVAEFKRRETRLDILVNNAGVMSVPTRQLTADGFEMQFGTNHLGHFLLTNLLLDTLKAAAPSRIVNVSSDAHYYEELRRDNLNGEQSYEPFNAYCQSKLANVLFTSELAKRLHGTGVVANSLHPGAVRTDLQRFYPLLRLAFTPLVYLMFKTPRSGAQTQIMVAVDPELATVSGKFFKDCVVRVESKAAMDDASAAWLWQESEKLVGLVEQKQL